MMHGEEAIMTVTNYHAKCQGPKRPPWPDPREIQRLQLALCFHAADLSYTTLVYAMTMNASMFHSPAICYMSAWIRMSFLSTQRCYRQTKKAGSATSRKKERRSIKCILGILMHPERCWTCCPKRQAKSRRPFAVKKATNGQACSRCMAAFHIVQTYLEARHQRNLEDSSGRIESGRKYWKESCRWEEVSEQLDC